MTEQEILALTEEDVQKMIKLRMMEEGIKYSVLLYSAFGWFCVY